MLSEEILTKEKANNWAERMNLGQWVFLQTFKGCFYGCKKFKEPLYIKSKNIKGAKILNGNYLAHLYTTHGFPPSIFIEELAKKIYNNEGDRREMINFYKFVE